VFRFFKKWLKTPRTTTLRMESLEDRSLPASSLTALGADANTTAVVKAYQPDGTLAFQVMPFGSDFQGGIRVAVGNVLGSSVPNVIAVPGPGAKPEAVILNGSTGDVLKRIPIFEDAFVGGMFVASGDLNGDGLDDLVVTPDQGGGPRVKVINGQDGKTIADFFGIDDSNFRGGARPAVGDFNGDGRSDLAVAAGFGGGPRIAVFNGQTLTNGFSPSRLLPDFFAFEQELRNGVFISAGNLDTNRSDELVFGGGPGGAPRVMVISTGQALATSVQAALSKPLANFFAGDVMDRSGVRVGVSLSKASQPVVTVSVGSGREALTNFFSLDGQTVANALTSTAGFIAGYLGNSPITTSGPNSLIQNILTQTLPLWWSQPISTPSNPTPSPSTSTPTVPTTSPATVSTTVQNLLNLHNQQRKQTGLADLVLDSQLIQFADNQAKWMANNRTLQHADLSPLLSSFSRVGENIASGQTTEQQAVNDWMNSSGHRANILNSKFTKVGFGLAYDSRGTPYWCTNFGA
jgi:hypothetical protein